MARLNKKEFRNSILKTKYKLDTDAQCFFVQRINELLFHKTFNSYQYKLHNTKSLLYEIRDVIQLVNEGKIGPSNLSTLVEELKVNMNEDITFNKHFQKFKHNIFKFKNRDFSENKKEKVLNLQFKIELVLNSLKQENYSLLIILDLEEAIHNEKYEDISKLSTQLISEFLNNEVRTRSISAKFYDIFLNDCTDFSYKYAQFNKFLLEEEYKAECDGKLFIEISNYDKTRFTFDVTYDKNEIKKLLSAHPGSNIKNGMYLKREIKVYKDNIYLSIANEMEAVERENSLYSFNRETIRLNKENIILLLDENNNQTYKSILVNDFYTSNGNKSRSFLNKGHGEVLKELGKLSEYHSNDKDRIFSSLRNYNIASRPNSQETTLLMLWSSLESLLKLGHYSNNIDHIINIVPKLLSNNYSANLMENFLGELKRLSILSIEWEQENITLNKNLEEVLKCKDKSNILKIRLENYTLLQFRVDKLAKLVRDKGNSIELMEKHKERIEWHLYRIYRLRNNLIHSAKTNQHIDHLNGHLDFYVRETLSYTINNTHMIEQVGLGGMFEDVENKFNYKISQV